MHNITRKKIQNLATELVKISVYGNVNDIKEKSIEIYESTILLKYIENQSGEKTESHTDSEALIDSVFDNNINLEGETVGETIDKTMKESTLEQVEQNLTSEDTAEVTEEAFVEVKKEEREINVEDEFKDSISADDALDLFEKEETEEPKQKSLNDKISQGQIQVGLNDRIAFVKHLFSDNEEDLNRVLSLLSTFVSEQDAVNFIKKNIEPKHGWEGKEEYAERFYKIIENKFS